MVRYKGEDLCIVSDGYMWLQQFPLNKRHSVTTMFNAAGEIVQWYIDICYKNSMDNNIPYMDDLFLDLIFLPSEDIIKKDAEDLEKALLSGIIDKHLYEAAWAEQRSLLKMISNDYFALNWRDSIKNYCLIN
jgi:uncharacterized protein